MSRFLISGFIFLTIGIFNFNVFADLNFVPKSSRHFKLSTDGQLEAVITKPIDKFSASIRTSEKYPSGWYRMTGKYKTTGFTPMGSFVMSVKGTNSPMLWQTVPSASLEVPFELYFRLDEETDIIFNLKQIKKCEAGGRIVISELNIEKYDMPSGKNLLGNPDFAFGKLGEVPTMWRWKYEADDGDFMLVQDKSFRSVSQVMQVKCGGDKGRTLNGVEMPLQSKGKMTFSVWARSDDNEMSLNLRLLGDKYKWSGHEAFLISKTWKKYSVSCSCPSSFDNIYFWPRISIKGLGTVRLAGASLIWDASSAESEKKSDGWVAVSGKNMLPNPDFDLGWNGWMLDFFAPKKIEDTIKFTRSEECRIIPEAGVEGGSALYLPTTPSLISGCVPIKEGKTYTLSAYMKATDQKGKAMMFLIDPGWKIFKKSIQKIPSDKWTRYSFTFKWDKPSKQKRAYARLNADNVLIDRVQLEEGELTDYEAPVLALGMTTASNNIFFQAEKILGMELKIVAGKNAGESVKIDIETKDAWGKTQWEKKLTVPGSSTTIIPIEVPGNRLGVFELLITAKDDNGKILGRAKSRYAVVNSPSFKSKTEFPLFGITFETYLHPCWLIEKSMPVLRMMGANLNRFFLMTQAYDKLPSSEYFKLLENQCDIQRNMGLTNLVACFNSIPQELNDEIRLTENKDITEESVEKYCKYLRATVAPLQKHIKYWEIMNEPNLWRYKEGPLKGLKTMPPEKYARFLKAAYKTIKEINPELKVVGVCLNGNAFEYLEKVLQAGCAEYMDVFSFHSYRASPDLPDVYSDLRTFRVLLDKYGFKGPMINSEQYYAANKFIMRGSDLESGRGYYVPGQEELRSCGRTIRNYIHHIAAGVSYCAFSPRNSQFRYGGFDRFYIYNLYAAYNAATRFLGDAGKGYPLQVGEAMRVFVFPDAPAGSLLTFYTPSPELKGSIVLSGKYRAFDIMGNAFSSEDMKNGLPLATDPIYLQFEKGVSVDEIKELIANAKVSGLGEPFSLQLQVKNRKSLNVKLSNMHNRSFSGKVSILDMPVAWKCETTTIPFDNLKPGETRTIEFTGDMPMKNMGRYPIRIMAEAGDEFVSEEIILSPLFASQIREVKADASLAEWENSEWISLGEDNLSLKFIDHKGPEDLAAKMAFGWNENAFAIAVIVNDDAVSNPESAAHAYANDSLQIYFDQLNNAPNGKALYDNDDVVYAVSLVNGQPCAWVEKGSAGRYVGEGNNALGLDKDVEIAIIRKDGKIIYEIVFPKQCLPFAKLEAGRGFGFSLLVNDNDGEGRKTGLSFSPKGDEPYKKPYQFRDLSLIGEKINKEINNDR